MNLYKRDNFWIEVDNYLFNFYSKEGKIVFVKFEDYKVKENKVLLEDCRLLNSVILSKDNSITLIYTSLKGDLILVNLINDNVENKIILIKNTVQYKDLEIVSLNNSLNLFYINEINNISTLCFRVLSNKLTLSQPIIMDGIDGRGNIPYLINYANGQLSLAYCKKGSPNYFGFRKFDFQRNSWSDFVVLDSYYALVEDMNFIVDNNVVGYYLSYSKHKKSNIILGLGPEDQIKRTVIEENNDNMVFCNLVYNGKEKYNLLYLIGNTLKIKEIDREISTVDEIVLNNIEYIGVGNLASNKEIISNRILIVKDKEQELFTDTNFVNRISVKRYQEFTGLSKFLTENSIDDTVELEELQSDDTETLLKQLINKNKKYEEVLSRMSERLMIAENERKKLIDKIDDINQQLTKKNQIISSFEKSLTERQTMVAQYERKVQDLSNSLKNQKVPSNDSEIIRLKEGLKHLEIEKTNYLNELRNYKSISEQLKRELEENKTSVNIDKSNFTRLSQTLTETSLEKQKLESEIQSLQKRLNEVNIILGSLKEENYNLNRQIIIMEEKNKDSFIKKLFKTGE